MHSTNFDIASLLEKTGFKAPELPSSFKIDNWPNWLSIHHGFLEKIEFQEVRIDKAGFKIENPRKDKLYFFVNRDGSYGFGWSFVFHHTGPEIGFHTYHSASQNPEERLTALLFFAQHGDEILRAIEVKLAETKDENNQAAEIFMKIMLPVLP